MRKISILSVLLALFSFCAAANASNELSKDYWLKKLENFDLKYGYYDNDTILVVVGKEAKNLRAFSYKNGALSEVFNTPVIIGKTGEKLVEGDLKTPVGVYQLTRRFTPSDRYLGPLAFALSYPNLLDRLAKRNGGGIWIHGYPLDGGRTDELKTKGCVAMQNDTLLKFDEVIDHKKALAIIHEQGEPRASAGQIAAIMSELFRWKKMWAASEINEYLKFYDENFTRYDGMNFSRFKAMKSEIFSRKGEKKIVFSNFLITPYPNIKNENIFRVSFYEDYASKTHKFQGQKTLYVKLNNDEIKIFIEE